MDGCDIFKITKYTPEHTCLIEVLNHDHKQACEFVIGQLIKDKIGLGRADKPHHIIKDKQHQYSANISYDKE